MKKLKSYLIRIEGGRGRCEYVSIYGDCACRPFSIAHNLWNYTSPGHAARRLERLAAAWESHGIQVQRVYGTIDDMPTKGNEFNVAVTLRDFRC